MTVIYIDLTSGAQTAGAPWSYNEFNSGSTSIGTLSADLKDDSNASTGIGLDVTSIFSGVTGSTSQATAGAGGWPEEVFESVWYTNGTATLQLTGLTDGDSYSIEVAGHASNAARDADFTIGGTTTRYDSAGTGAPNAPITFSGTVSGTTLDIDTAVVSTFAYINGLKITITAAGLTIDSTDASMQRVTNWQMVVSNPSTAPTTGNTTLTNDTTVLTPSSVTGSDPYTLTFPVGDMDKQVDATGYPWTLDINAETVVTANIPLTIQAGYTLVDLVSPDTTNASLLFGADRDAPVTGDHLEYDVTSTLDSGVTLSVAATGVWTVTEATEGDWVTDITVSRRVVQVDGSIGTEAVVTLNAATGLTTITSLVTPLVSNMTSSMVN